MDDEDEVDMPVADPSPLERDADDLDRLNAASMQTYMNELGDSEQGGKTSSMVPEPEMRTDQVDMAYANRRPTHDTSKTNYARVSGMARTTQKKKVSQKFKNSSQSSLHRSIAGRRPPAHLEDRHGKNGDLSHIDFEAGPSVMGERQGNNTLNVASNHEAASLPAANLDRLLISPT